MGSENLIAPLAGTYRIQISSNNGRLAPVSWDKLSLAWGIKTINIRFTISAVIIEGVAPLLYRLNPLLRLSSV